MPELPASAAAAGIYASGSAVTPQGRVWGAMTKVDLSLTWRLTRYATFFVTGRNIANQKDLYYESAPGVQEGKQKNLRNAEAYGDNWIFGVRGQF